MQYLDDNPTGTPSDVFTISATLTDDDGGTEVIGIRADRLKYLLLMLLALAVVSHRRHQEWRDGQ